MDADQYLYVDLGGRFYVTSVATQGRRAAKEYVTVYNIMYSDNGHNWFYYTDEDKIIMVLISLDKTKTKCWLIYLNYSFRFRIFVGIEMTTELFEMNSLILW